MAAERLAATDIAPLLGVTTSALYKWKRLFETEGPAGLEDRPRGAPTGSKLSEATRRTILLRRFRRDHSNRTP